MTPFNIVRHDSNGKYSQIFPKVFPNASLGKYIPLVKQTSCTRTLDIPDDAFSDTVLPIIIPIAINKIEIIIDTSIVEIMLILKLNPNIMAKTKNKVF